MARVKTARITRKKHKKVLNKQKDILEQKDIDSEWLNKLLWNLECMLI